MIAHQVARRERKMVWALVVLLLILWLAGIVLDVAGGFIHLLLLAALLVLVLELLARRPHSV
jgi:hypothetical protein